MSAEVFVSYSSQDHTQVSKIIERLRKAGVSVWMDEGGIDAATLWSEAIVEAINDCKVLIMMVSKHSTDSANVVKEVMLASESSKTILPVYLEPADIPTRLKYQLTGIQHSEAHSLTPDELLDELLRGLAKNGVTVPGYEKTKAAASAQSPSHKKRRGRQIQWKLPAIIKEKVQPESVVYTDSFKAYNALDVSAFHHRRINHSTLFAEERNHINGIENFWNQAKRHLRRFNGIKTENFYWFLKECEWRFNGGNHQMLLKQLKHWVKRSSH